MLEHGDLVLLAASLFQESVRHRGLVPVQTVNLITLDIVGSYHCLSWHVHIRRIEDRRDLGFGAVPLRLIIDPVQDGLLLNETRSSIDIQENAVREKTRLREVAGPHLKLMAGDIDSLILLEVLWQLSNLLEVLRTQHRLNQSVEEVKDFNGHIRLHLARLV